MSGERHIEMTWRCSTCKNRNLGRHLNCGACGKPKEEHEEYEMPDDTASAATVEDPNLLRMANADANWKCQYCGSSQRALDGGCARCGAGRREGANAPMPFRSAFPEAPTPASRAEPSNSRGLKIIGLALIALVFGTCVVMKKVKPRTVELPDRSPPTVVTAVAPKTDYPATVARMSWSRQSTIERWQLAPHEGFTAELPPNAVNVKAAGEHFHHTEEVFDHNETVIEEVEVSDGTRAETYSTREACGEDCTGGGRTCHQECTSRPQTCREVCSGKKNGFASCKQVCSGGGQDCHEVCSGTERRCTTRYCDRTKTKQTPKTKREKRETIVKKYRQEPRNAPWSTFATWEWVKVREAETHGDGTTASWPDAGPPKMAADLPDGGTRAGAEREVKKENYRVFLKYEDGQEREYDPKTEDELGTFKLGSVVQTRVYGLDVTILGGDASP